MILFYNLHIVFNVSINGRCFRLPAKLPTEGASSVESLEIHLPHTDVSEAPIEEDRSVSEVGTQTDNPKTACTNRKRKFEDKIDSVSV